LRFSFNVSKLWMFIKYWLPSVAWMVLIFSASADSHSSQRSYGIVVPVLHWLFPHMPQAQIEALHHYTRKTAHLTEYAILALLLRRTLFQVMTNLTNPWSVKLVFAVILLVFLYAASDEFHQSFIPGRTALFSDVLIDTAGGTAGLLLGWLFYRVRKKC